MNKIMGILLLLVYACIATAILSDGRFLMAYPLHPQDKPENAMPDQLFRIIAPLLFMQGDRDRTCDLDVLRNTLIRVG